MQEGLPLAAIMPILYVREEVIGHSCCFTKILINDSKFNNSLYTVPYILIL